MATGGAGTDTLVSIESAIGSSYNDTLIGGNGDNYLYGGAGIDTTSYLAATGGVFVNLDNGQVTGAMGNDALGSIEVVQGSNYID